MAVLLHLIVFLASLFFPTATAIPLYAINGTNGKFISNSVYSSNLNLLFSSLSSNASAAAGFAATSTGRVPDRVYGHTLCRGDTNIATCRSCIHTAVSDIQLLCPNFKDAIIWYDDCQLSYSSQDFLYAPNVTSDIQILMFNNQNVPADQLLRSEILTAALLGNLSDLAVRNKSRLFATGETVLSAGNIIYGLVQCAPDLSVGGCRTCLEGTVDATTEDPLKGKMGGRMLGIWCNMRYEFYKFYNGSSMLQFSSDQSPSPSPSLQPLPPTPLPPIPPPSPLSPTPPTQNVTHSPVDSSNGGSNNVDIVLAITIPIVVGLVRIAIA
ncbi:hypothetical protein M5K25_019439 [Dendrobium thyrsiflorum]|uniref:Gnk2-homologous domain-containing protein n=1 Tax=Dendrobium thyrsiflorum TaxID=117978 RepID=A0ABD0ULL3_DENTH